MAIEKEIKQPSNIITTYHKLEDIQGIFSSGLCEIVIGSYVNADSRFTGALPAWKEVVSFRLSPEAHNKIKTIIYDNLPKPFQEWEKVDPDFMDNLEDFMIDEDII